MECITIDLSKENTVVLYVLIVCRADSMLSQEKISMLRLTVHQKVLSPHCSTLGGILKTGTKPTNLFLTTKS